MIQDEEQYTREKNPMFFKLFDLINIKWWKEEDKGKDSWKDFEIYAKTTTDLEMSVWNGRNEPSVISNCKKHTCKKGTRVRVWMVSRHGDVGVTDNLINPNGYHARGLNADTDLTDYEFIKKNGSKN